VDLQLDRFRKLLDERRIELTVSDTAKWKIAEIGYDPAFGARPLKRAIQRLIQDPLALRLLDGSIKPGSRVQAQLEGDEITLHTEEVVVN
jgi:ATP-dependent Clp protease ATP-binding subunit ClpB